VFNFYPILIFLSSGNIFLVRHFLTDQPVVGEIRVARPNPNHPMQGRIVTPCNYFYIAGPFGKSKWRLWQDALRRRRSSHPSQGISGSSGWPPEPAGGDTGTVTRTYLRRPYYNLNYVIIVRDLWRSWQSNSLRLG
jgi:hypothetical protein